jgi:MFS family permease
MCDRRRGLPSPVRPEGVQRLVIPPSEPIRIRPWWRRLLSLAAVDIRPLRRHRDFRLLFTGRTISFFGSMMTYVALPYQTYRLSGSTLAVGLLGLTELIPLLLFAFLGGALADAVDRKWMVRLTELLTALATLALLVNALLPHPALWAVYAVAAVMSGLDALQRPSLEAMMPRLVDRDELTATSALNSLGTGLGMVVGPAIGGVLIAAIGLSGAYLIDLLSFSATLTTLALMKESPPPPDAERPSIRRVMEGIRYARSRPELIGTYVVDIAAMFFGMPTALFPAMAPHYGGPSVLGLLYAAPAVGSLIAGATSGWASRVHRHGRAIIFAAAGWGAAIALFGLVEWLPAALFFLAMAGAADEISGIFRGTIWNQTIPDSLRGRLAAIEMLSYASGPSLGNLESGGVASLVGVRATVISGGVLCVASVVLLALALPAFRAYDERTHPPLPSRDSGVA